jgi:alpha-L-arabinofuranosidase
MTKLILGSLFLMLTCNVHAVATISSCSETTPNQINVVVNTNKVIRQSAPQSLFGFNIPWHAFDVGLQDKGAPKLALLKLLEPFKGALYRYPGGAPSNSFDWQNSVLPLAQRKPTHFEYGSNFVPEFGLAEFLNFVKIVDGKAIFTINMVGKSQQQVSPDEVSKDAIKLVDWMLNKSSSQCVGGENCPLAYLELGNELDWTPYLLSSTQYVDRANSIIVAVGNKVPDVAWIVGGQSAPWDNKNHQENHQQFNKTLAKKLPLTVQYFSYHPYYDGNSIPEVMRYADSYYDVWQQQRSQASLMITEHARWPYLPKTGQWQENWHEASGQSGAISTADFILNLIPDKRVNGAVWHSLGVLGPWQLIRVNQSTKDLYPSPVYWAMRTIREAYLQDVIEVSPNLVKGNQYVGGYELRLVAMKSPNKVSLLGVNRSDKPAQVIVNWQGLVAKHNGEMRVTTMQNFDATNDDNDDQHPQKITMQTLLIEGMVNKSFSSLCVPAHAVFSYQFNS